MIALDTNLWARAILGDDPRQSRVAQQAIQEGSAGPGVFVPLLVLVELGWVLKSAPEWTPARVRQALDRVLNMEGVEVEAAPLAREALRLATGSVGFADHLFCVSARHRGCDRIMTFDARLAKTGFAELLKG